MMDCGWEDAPVYKTNLISTIVDISKAKCTNLSL